MRPKPDACRGCPSEFTNQGFAPGEGSLKAPIVLIGEALGEAEAEMGRPFVGATEKMLRIMLRQAGLSESEVYITNTVKCRPPGNRKPTQEEVNECKTRYLDTELTENGANVFVPVGDTALRALLPHLHGGITRLRGSVFPYNRSADRAKVLPIVHPSFVAQGNPEHWSITVCDLMKAKKESLTHEITRPKEHFNLFPSLQDIRALRDRLLRNKGKFAFDIETIGTGFYEANLLCLGIAESGTDATCIPFLRRGGIPYWAPPEEEEVVAILADLFESDCRKITQNGFPFDLPVLQTFGWRFAPPVEDTLIKHHVVAAELPHSLAFLVSVYTPFPFYKDDVKGEGGMLFASDETVRTYNCRDCCATFLISDALDEELKELQLY